MKRHDMLNPIYMLPELVSELGKSRESSAVAKEPMRRVEIQGVALEA
jgi:hypothetical protein